jgi:putative ABC transport system permease protein
VSERETPSISLRVLMKGAIRNLARHRRRTAVNALSVAATTAILAFFMGYYRGSYEELLYSSIIDYQTAHVQVQTARFDKADADAYARPENLVPDWRGLLGEIRGVDGVVEAAPRLLLAGFAGDGTEKFPLLIAGVEPEAERTVGVAERSIIAGADLEDSGSILIGESFAKLFGLEPGSRCVLQTWTANGTPNIRDFTVSGVFRTGYAPLDRTSVFVRMGDAQALADTGDKINKIFVKCRETRAVEASLPAIAAAARTSGVTAESWRTYAEGILQHSQNETYFYYIFLVILFALSVSTIANTMYVSVFQRTREIGSLRAIGWRRGEVFRLFLFEAAAVGVLGGAVGTLIGAAASFTLYAFPIDLRSMSSAMEIPFFEIKSVPAAIDFVGSAAAGFVCAVLAGTTPARRAARVDVVRALTTH